MCGPYALPSGDDKLRSGRLLAGPLLAGGSRSLPGLPPPAGPVLERTFGGNTFGPDATSCLYTKLALHAGRPFAAVSLSVTTAYLIASSFLFPPLYPFLCFI